MALYRNLKSIAGGSLRAIGNGAELFAEGTARLEYASGTAVVRQEIRTLKQQIRYLVADGESTSEALATLEATYRELQGRLDPAERDAVAADRARFHSDLSALRSDRALDAVRRAESAFADRVPGTPFAEATARRQLLWEIEVAMAAIGTTRPNSLTPLEVRVEALKREIAEQEAKRFSESVEHDEDGSLRYVVRRRDGVLHGKQEAWYSDAQRKAEASYEDGRFVGAMTCWDESGNTLVRYTPGGDGKSWVHELFLPDGTRIVRGWNDGRTAKIEAWWWNGIPMAGVQFACTSPMRPGLLGQILLRPRCWRPLHRSRHPGAERDGLELMRRTTDLHDWAVEWCASISRPRR